MKNIIVGTAGHIDHGKTTLIRALTGRNTDRWEEEQRRGITIDLGFTWFDLPSGNRVGIIDVPGHEKFVNNMVAGVVGMDLVLLVIAADEGIMPQTREHVDILGLLGIEKCIIVLNKCDLVDEDWLEMVKEDIREELKGSFCESAPMAEVSSVTGAGLDNLVSLIEHMAEEEVTPKDIDTIPRLPIDRAFSISGFGTIVTGTLISGRIRKEDQLEIYPVDKTCKIRSIQVHGKDAEECFAGQRVAINLSNIKKNEIHRGCVLAPVNSMKNTMMLDVRLRVLPSSNRVIDNRTRLHLFTGTSEVLCRAVLLDKDEIGPGESGLAQLRLEGEIAVRRGDRFIVRFYSPMETIGGGVVIEANPAKKKRFDERAISEMTVKEEGGHGDMIELIIKQNSDSAITAAEVAKLTGLTAEETMAEVAKLAEQGLVATFPMKKDIYLMHASYRDKVADDMVAYLEDFHKKNPYRLGSRKAELRVRFLSKLKQNSDSAITAAEVAKLTGLTAEETMAEVEKLAEQGLVATFPMKKDIYLMHASYRDKVTDDMVAYLEDFHKKNPYRLGSRKAELRVRFLSKLKQNVFDEFMQRLEDSGRIKRSGEFICEGGYEIPHDEVYKQFESALTAMLDKAGFEFIRLADIQLPGIQPAMAEDLLQLLAAEGKVVLLSDDLITLPKYTDMVAAKAREILAAEGKISIAMIRDMIGTSRKSAKPLLEYLDNIRVTRRNGTESERVAY